MIDQELTRIAFVDDDDMLRQAHVQTLTLAGLTADAFPEASSALATIGPNYPGIVVTDVRMPGIDGLQLFARLHAQDPELPIILITGHGDVPMAVAALKDGAWDFLTKPFSSEQLLGSVRRALTARRLVLENRALREAAERLSDGDPLVGETPVMVELRRTMRQLAAADVDVLIEGETGTGKELVATLLHRWGPRRGRPFEAFDCGALPDHLAQSELFGHRDGVIPGLRLSRLGRIEAAEGGTLFLDQLEAMPSSLQAGMLRVLEEREVTPLGGDQSRYVDVRVIAAISGPGEEFVDRSVIRPELFHRLHVARLRLPPLRERRDDIPLLFAHFVEQSAIQHRMQIPPFTQAIRDRLLTHDWPGNVRELANFANRVALTLDEAAASAEPVVRPLSIRTQDFEAQEIRHSLARHGGNVQAALGELQIPRKTLYDKIKRYGITPRDFRD